MNFSRKWLSTLSIFMNKVPIIWMDSNAEPDLVITSLIYCQPLCRSQAQGHQMKVYVLRLESCVAILFIMKIHLLFNFQKNEIIICKSDFSSHATHIPSKYQPGLNLLSFRDQTWMDEIGCVQGGMAIDSCNLSQKNKKTCINRDFSLLRIYVKLLF